MSFLFVSVGIWVKPCVDGYDLNGESLAGLEDVEYNNDNDSDHNLRGFSLFVTDSIEWGFGAVLLSILLLLLLSALLSSISHLLYFVTALACMPNRS